MFEPRERMRAANPVKEVRHIGLMGEELAAFLNTIVVGFEEPENGVHPRRIQLIAELLKTQETLRQTQYIVTTHSPVLPDFLADGSLFAGSTIAAAERAAVSMQQQSDGSPST